MKFIIITGGVISGLGKGITASSVGLLLKLSGLKDVKQEIEPKFWRPIDIQFQDGDATKIKEELGWNPEYSIEETLKDLLDYWYKKID